MRSAVIDKESFATVGWDDNYFKYCNFEGFSADIVLIASDFVNCSFKNVEWYGGLFNHTNFISCEFIDCQFMGASFPDSRFIECTLENCRFLKDSVGRECDFSRAVAYECRVKGCEGFMVGDNA